VVHFEERLTNILLVEVEPLHPVVVITQPTRIHEFNAPCNGLSTPYSPIILRHAEDTAERLSLELIDFSEEIRFGSRLTWVDRVDEKHPT